MKFKALFAALTFGSIVAAPAQAATVPTTLGFDLSFAGNTNVPTFTLVNTSDAGNELVQFTFTIGNTTRHFDFVSPLSNPAGGTSTLNTPDTVNDGVRSDTISINFTGFDAGESISFAADIDVDPTSNVVQDFRNVFFNNGSALNSVATAFYAVGESVSFTLPDNPQSLQFSASTTINAVPLPAALPMLAAGLVGLGLLARRRKNTV